MILNLDTEISKINRLSKEHAVALKKLRLFTVLDILYYFPVRYGDERENKNITNLQKGGKVILFGEIRSLKIKRSFHGHIPMCEGKLVDATGSIKLIWFHQAYIAKMYSEGEFVKVSGLVQEKNGIFSILNANIERASRDHVFYENSLFTESESKENKNHATELIPIYKETKGITSNYIRTLIKKIFSYKEILEELKKKDSIPENILENFHLPPLDKALLYIHLPKAKDFKSAENQILSARKRFSFEEIFHIQILKQIEKAKAKDSLSYKISASKNILDEFISNIEIKNKFKITNAQARALKALTEDINKDEPMSRLLEGDVGSGKTLIAAAISYLITHNLNRDIENKKRLQVAYMAPTEILATQHFESFQKMFIGAGVEIGLLTGKVCKKFPSKINPNSSTNISKNQLKKWIESGEISIVIGTHSLIQDGISFQNLALAVVDEQHRFGVRQRAKLANKKSQTKKTLVANDLKNLTNKKQTIETQKEKLPHLLSMTATPIPRTLALTIFGDLDLTVIDEMPKNRKKIDTQIIQEKDREKIYLEIAKEIKAGYQAYIIVPRIDELDDEDMQNNKKLNLRSVSSETKSLISFFNDKNKLDINIVGIHSKINKEEKEKIMQDFANKRIDVLVATSLVEVGVNVPNASRMIIESAERFGLAQLHQLRGRIGRGERESICYLFTNSTSDITSERLSSLLKAKNGFELAEYDLAQRGIGSLMSGKQWGVSDLAMEAIKNIKLVEAAREEARKIIQADRELGKYPMLREIIFVKEKVHME